MSSVTTRTPTLGTPIRFIKPTVPPIQEVLESYKASFVDGILTTGSVVARLEAEAAERIGVSHCIAVSSCTSGLVLVLKALGIKGDVILPSFTFFATGHAVLWNELRPVFADCGERSWTLDPADTEAHITERTGAIIAVHLYGNPARVDELQHIARRHGLKLIFDAAHAFGSSYRGMPVGQFGDAEVFSMSPTKLLVAGEGGLVCTNDATLARLIRVGRNYGDSGSYDPELLGLNARLPEFNAALALTGLALVNHKVARHNAIADRYTELLGGIEGIEFQKVCAEDISAYKDFSVLIDQSECGVSRDQVADALAQQGIPTKRYFYPPLHKQRLFRSYAERRRQVLAHTDRISGSVLSLPIYESLSPEDVDRIAYAVRDAVAEA